MNALFLTQSTSLDMFYRLAGALREPLALDKIGFYATSSMDYEGFLKQTPEIESGSYSLLKEWEIIEQASGKSPDLEYIKNRENEIGDPGLWSAIVADRWLYQGKNSSFRQDYSRRYTHEELLSILEQGIKSIERFFDEVKPDVVFSFICVTFGEYLAYLIAKRRGIPFLNLRPTRIKDYVILGESIFEPSELIKEAFERYERGNGKASVAEEARRYMDFVAQGHAMYEGVIPPSAKAPAVVMSKKSIFTKASKKLKNTKDSFQGRYKHDNQYPGSLGPLLYQGVLNPRRAKQVNAMLSPGYMTEDKLKNTEYVFYPLHKEPEVTLLVYSRAYLNQIEVVRNFAANIPVGMKLVVKEHPASVGWRSQGFYKKLLEIPNVVMADPSIVSKTLIKHSSLVAIIAGSIGFEALLLKRPVVSLGNCPFNILPDTMIRKVESLEGLGLAIQELLEGYTYDEKAVLDYVAANMECGVQVSLYSKLLGKRGVYSLGGEGGVDADIERLAEYAVTDAACKAGVV